MTTALKGRWHGRYGMVCCPVHPDKTPSLKLSDNGDSVTVHCFAGCDWRMVKAELRAMDLLSDFEGECQLRETRRRHGDIHCRRLRDNAQSGPGSADPQRSVRAREIWAAAQPVAETLVETYLRGRGITVDIPPTIRYAPALKHAPSGLWLPVMVAAVTVWPGKEVRAIHRTYLKADGSAKAPSTQAKMLLGPSRGGAVRLAAAAEQLIVAEGIETALSVMQITGKPTWAAISAGGIAGFRLPDPPLAMSITIAADNDAAGQQAAEKAAAKWIQEGRTVEIATPPKEGADWNDALKGCEPWAA